MDAMVDLLTLQYRQQRCSHRRIVFMAERLLQSRDTTKECLCLPVSSMCCLEEVHGVTQPFDGDADPVTGRRLEVSEMLTLL